MKEWLLNPKRMVDNPNPDNVVNWFAGFGTTDVAYLRSSFPRFQATYEFVQTVPLKEGSSVLDIGAHWLHQAFFYANEGHVLYCIDDPHTFREESVKWAAKAMGATLLPCSRLDRGDAINDLEENSIDLVLFCEIVEHITFNPIPMWKSIYRVLKPGGRIILTTPNSAYFESLWKRLHVLLADGCYGIGVADIFETGTYGHHWKEYSIPELETYFGRLSPDFKISRRVARTLHATPQQGKATFASLCAQGPTTLGAAIGFGDLVTVLQKRGLEPFSLCLFFDIVLRAKATGIQIAPPWII
jgi:SAM-dependent methyltransferase